MQEMAFPSLEWVESLLTASHNEDQLALGTAVQFFFQVPEKQTSTSRLTLNFKQYDTI